jgi:predicted DNA-binding transcriptional regulator AlpA
MPLVSPAVSDSPPGEKANASLATSKPATRRTRKRADQVDVRTINLDQPGFLNIDQVLALMSISKSGFYAGILKNLYPASVRLGGKRRVGWPTAEIKKLVDRLAAGGTKT